MALVCKTKGRIFGVCLFSLFLVLFCSASGLAGTSLSKKFGFPDVWDRIGVLTDQLPSNMNDEEIKFAGTHYVGSQKLSLSITNRLRKYNPDFVVLHYHLGIWQQQPAHQFIIDGEHWGNDWEYVSKHEEWFWHNIKGERVRSSQDGKYLMNIMNPEFQEYWKTSLVKQMQAGKYQGVFLDSSSVDLLQWEASQGDKRLSGTVARDCIFSELGGLTWSRAYETFMRGLKTHLEANGFAAIPNINAQMTTWDNTDYFNTATGAFMESSFMTRSTTDWEMAAERTLKLTARDKIVIFQPYLNNDNDIDTRMYYLGCYLLLKGRYSYIVYFHKSHLSWYPEYDIQLGAPSQIPTRLSELRVGQGIYARRFERGMVFVNPTGRERDATLDKKYWRIIPEGGGPIDKAGKATGRLRYEEISKIILPPWSAVVILNEMPGNTIK